MKKVVEKKKPVKKRGSLSYNAQARIAELEEEIQNILDEEHNKGVNGAVLHYKERLERDATPAELKFKQIAECKHLNLEFQYRIDVYQGRRIIKVYYADFCDTKHKIVFEIDGSIHDIPEQKKYDFIRTKRLNKMGYRVYRIRNSEVFSGKTTAFLYRAYKAIGIDITQK